ncbi:5'-nucleotidase, lipoprotein e(P4) family [Mucilaginibacter lutimaris]|uniref:5'-nucleotidase, lipoprotein e(P4) family n=1 Tax=Mucilaginibacter lutimaris TaxID=931629 RepID=A0ABW2ZGY4_9SPHI
MMKKFVGLTWLSVVIIFAACRQSGEHTAPDNNLALLPGGPAWGALYQQRAGEYKALCYQAYNIAKLRLEEYARQKSSLPKAIITDIDETVLDNSPYFVDRAKKGETYSDSSWIEWTAQLKCDTVPGAVRFLKHAQELGVTVFYVTNRFAKERQATLENLRKFGLPNTDDAHLFLMGEGGSSKENRRKAIRKTHNVLLLMGDNLGDFSKDFDVADPAMRTAQAGNNINNFGSRFIIFPNTMYGSWEDRLYQKGERSLNDKNNILKALIK